MNFNKITIQSESNGTVIITPENFYKIPESEICYVVMYSLKFINSNPEIPEIESKIPYYISNGTTNKLRANMLYPFMCYSHIDEIVNCPFDWGRYNPSVSRIPLLLKYNIFSNIDIDRIEQDLLSTFLGIYPDLSEENRLLREKVIIQKKQPANDLISVLERITNLLDFIICITNDVISKFNYETEQVAIDNGKYRPLSIEQKRVNDYTDLSIYGEETTYNIGRKVDDSSSSFNNHFRLVILTILNKYYKLFVDNNIINIETIQLHPEIISMRIFNRIVNLCNKESAQRNILHYKLVSKQIVTIITENLDRIHTIPEQNRSLLRSIILHTDRNEINNDELYNKLLNNWNGICYSTICKNLKTEYYEVIRKIDPAFAEEIRQNCPDDLSQLNEDTLKDFLIKIRKEIPKYEICRITIFREHNKSIEIDIRCSETIASLKDEIFTKVGIDKDHQKLYIGIIPNKRPELENDRSIFSYGITEAAVFRLVVE
jgi:hypothetical protein